MGNPTTTPIQITGGAILPLTSSPTAQPAGTWLPDVPTTIMTFSGSNSATPESSVSIGITPIASPSLHVSQTETQRSFISSPSSAVLTLSGSPLAVSSTDSSLGPASSSVSKPTQSAVTDPPNSASGSSHGKSPLTGLFTSSATSTDPLAASQSGEYSVRPSQSPSDPVIGSHSHQPLTMIEGGDQVPATLKSQTTSAGFGAIILGGLGIAGSTIINQQTSSQQNLPSTTVSSSMPQASSITKPVISQGGSVITISGMNFSLGSAGLVVGSETLTMKPLDSTAANPAQQTPTTIPKPFSIASEGSTIQSGGSATILPSTSSSLAHSGTPNIGGSLGVLTLSVITAISQEFIANPTAFSIMGTTISVGGHGVTISGAIVSLASSGNLVIGSVIASSSPSAFTNAGESSIATATVSSAIPQSVSANSSNTIVFNSRMSSMTSGISMGGSAVASFTLTTSASVASTNAIGGVGATLSGTAVVLKSSETLLIGPSSTVTLPNGNKNTMTAAPKAGQSKVAVPRFDLLLTIWGAALFCHRQRILM